MDYHPIDGLHSRVPPNKMVTVIENVCINLHKHYENVKNRSRNAIVELLEGEKVRVILSSCADIRRLHFNHVQVLVRNRNRKRGMGLIYPYEGTVIAVEVHWGRLLFPFCVLTSA